MERAAGERERSAARPVSGPKIEKMEAAGCRYFLPATLAQESLRVTVLLKTGFPAAESTGSV